MKLCSLAHLACLFVLVVLPVSCASAGAGGLRPSDFSARTVDIQMGGLMSMPEGLVLGLSLVNKSDALLWVQVNFESPDPMQRCLLVEKLEPGGSHLYTCPQRTITPDVDYPIHLRVFADAALTQLIESPETKFRFEQESLEALQSIPR